MIDSLIDGNRFLKKSTGASNGRNTRGDVKNALRTFDLSVESPPVPTREEMLPYKQM